MIGEFNKDQNALPFTAASIVVPYMPVLLDTGAAKRQVVPIATTGIEPVGLSGAATTAQGEAVTVYGEGAVVEAISVASIGAGQDVAVSSTNGALAAIAAASSTAKFRVGRTLEPADDGERFSLYVSPRQLSTMPV